MWDPFARSHISASRGLSDRKRSFSVRSWSSFQNLAPKTVEVSDAETFGGGF